MRPGLPRHLEQICRRAGREWADTPHFHTVLDWLNATPGKPQPPLRYLLNLTHLHLSGRSADEVPDRLQSFWYDARNGYQMRVRGYYDPRTRPSVDLNAYFWPFLTRGLCEFCARTEGARRKRGRVQVVPLAPGDEGSAAPGEIADDDPRRQPEAAVLRDHLSEPWERAMEKLTDFQRKVLAACLDEEADRAKIAAEMGVTVNHLNVMFLRIKRLLKKTVEEEGNGGGGTQRDG